jgi:hypothetical protein
MTVPSRRKRDACALALVFVLTGCIFWKLLLTSQFTFIESGDIGHQVLPWMEVQARGLHHGGLALWDPYLFGGQPLLGQVQPAVASPFTWLLTALPLTNDRLRLGFVHYWFVLLHCLAGCFAYFFIRDLGRSRPASIIGGVFYAGTGFIGNTPWPQIMAGAVWIPLIFLFALRAFQGRRTVANAAFAGLFFGLALLSGHHAVPLFTALAVAGTALALAWRSAEQRATIAVAIPIIFICGGLVGAVQLVPAIEYGHYAVRWVNASHVVDWKTVVPYTVHEALGLNPLDLIFIVIPGGGSGMINPIAGVVALTLAAFAFSSTWLRQAAKPFVALGIAAILFAMARFDLAHGILYSTVPELEKARAPIMALSLLHFAIAALVGLGVDAFLESPRQSWTRAVAFVLLGASVFLFLFALYPPQPLRTIPFGAERSAVIAVVALLLAVLLFAWAGGRLSQRAAIGGACALLLLEISNSTGFSYVNLEDKESLVRPRLYGSTADLASFLASRPGPFRIAYKYEELLFNFGDWYGIESMEGYLPSVPRPIERLGWFNPRIRRLYGVQYWIGAQPENPAQRELFRSAGGWRVFDNPGAFPRAWTVHQVLPVTTPEQALEKVLSESIDLRRTAVMTGAPPALGECDDAPVDVAYEGLQSVRLEARMSCAGLVVLSDNVFPGWEAELDGRPVRILTADLALRAIAVPAGMHHISMRYRPASATWGLILTIAGLLLAAVLGQFGSREKLTKM